MKPLKESSFYGQKIDFFCYRWDLLLHAPVRSGRQITFTRSLAVNILTVENADVDAILSALQSGKVGQMEIVDIVSALFSKHQAFTQPLLAAYQIQLHQLLVRESILAHHGHLVNDDKQGEFAASLLKLAQDGLLILKYDVEGRTSSLLFESPRLPAVR